MENGWKRKLQSQRLESNRDFEAKYKQKEMVNNRHKKVKGQI